MSDIGAVRGGGKSVETVRNPLHATFTIDEVRQEVTHRCFVEERWLFVGPELDVGPPRTPVSSELLRHRPGAEGVVATRRGTNRPRPLEGAGTLETKNPL